MRKLIVMLGSDDGKEILFGHPGDAEEFYIYELREDGSYELLRKVKNEAKDMEEKHGGEGKMKKVLELIGKVDVILTRRNSPNLIRMAKTTEIQPVMVNAASIDEGMKILHKHFDEVYEMVERRRKGERFEVHKIRE